MKKRPPKIALWLLNRFRNRTDHESLFGDYKEMYLLDSEKYGRTKARIMFWLQVLNALPTFLYNSIYWSMIMFVNYFKIAWRNIVRQRCYSFINITGLAIGMTCCILILLWVQHELSYDKFNVKAKDIYRVVENQYYAGGEIFPVAVTPAALAPALKEKFPEIIRATRFSRRWWTIKYGEDIFNEAGGLADPEIFEIFTIPFIKGDPQTALSDPNSIVLTQNLAEKYFGDEEPIGKTLIINNDENFVVSGVIKNIPAN